MKRVDTSPRHKNSGRQHDGKRFPGHLAWLRKRPCLVEGVNSHVCEGRMEAAHVDRAGGKGVSLKVSDVWTVPLCSRAHADYHRAPRSFEIKFGLDLLEAAKQYAAMSPHKHLWEQ